MTGFNSFSIMTVLGVIATIVATVLLYVKVIPESKRASLPKALAFCHDVFNFKSLLIEKIVRFLYVILTVACVVIGFFMLFSVTSYYNFYGDTQVVWYGGYGILLMILGPIALRISFELMMMFILLVKNVIQINNKLGESKAGEEVKITDSFKATNTDTNE